jgi:hypothetical protein
MIGHFIELMIIQELHVRGIYSVHAKHPTILEHEPKGLDPAKLMDFDVRAANVRESVFGHNNILWIKDKILPRTGEETGDDYAVKETMDNNDFPLPMNSGNRNGTGASGPDFTLVSPPSAITPSTQISDSAFQDGMWTGWPYGPIITPVQPMECLQPFQVEDLLLPPGHEVEDFDFDLEAGPDLANPWLPCTSAPPMPFNDSAIT